MPANLSASNVCSELMLYDEESFVCLGTGLDDFIAFKANQPDKVTLSNKTVFPPHLLMSWQCKDCVL